MYIPFFFIIFFVFHCLFLMVVFTWSFYVLPGQLVMNSQLGLFGLNNFTDIPFLNYRMVNGLLKTAQGPPPGVTTTLVPPQDVTMKSEAMKCLVAILRSMGDWMNKQLRIPDPNSPKTEIEEKENDNSEDQSEAPQTNGTTEESSEGTEPSSENASGVPEAVPEAVSEAVSIEQRRAYKLELQVLIPAFYMSLTCYLLICMHFFLQSLKSQKIHTAVVDPHIPCQPLSLYILGSIFKGPCIE